MEDMATVSASASSKRKKEQKENNEEKGKYARKKPKKTILTPELFVAMINSGNVPEGTRMFFKGSVPYKLIKTCLENGLCHQDQMKLFLNGLAEKLGSVLQDKVKTVWLGVRKAFPHDPVFVLIPHNNETNLSKKDLPIPFRSFKCVFRHEYDVNDESRRITFAKNLRNILLGDEEKNAVYKVILGNLIQLHNCHSNIEKVHPSAVRSINYGHNNARLSNETCIVIYVHVKGIIPFSEEEFPSRIGNFPVDVREGKLYPYKDSGINYIQRYIICDTITKTLMNLKGMQARLRGLPEDGVATLTCANMIWFEDRIIYKPILPKFFIREDNPSDEGLETAVVETYNESRLSETETFQEDDTNTAGSIGLPPEILRMDEHSQQLYRDALQAGTQKVYNFRVMIVGHQGVGKTTLAKRILGENVADISPDKTKGIDIHYRCCKIDLATQEWCPVKAENRFSDSDQTLVAIVHEHINKETRSNIQHKEEMNITNIGTSKISSKPNQNEHMSELHQLHTTSYSSVCSNLLSDENKEVIYERKPVIDSKKPPNDHVRSLEDGEDCDGADKVINKDSLEESDFRKFVTRNKARTFSDKPYSYATLLDFAGQSVYYSTHQIFMSWRTVYLVVTDASKSLNDPVTGDVCSIDLSGNNKCSSQDIAVYWLNSIFSHGIPNPPSEIQPQQQVGNFVNVHEAKQYPPVIMVATHMDKVPEEMRNNREEEYFESLGRILKDRKLRFLVKGTFAISNIEPDADIDSLRRKIFELAQKQNYWGKEIPGRWAALEQKIFELKEDGNKVIQYSYIEKISQSSDIRIENPEELELFLRFEHDLGHIMFFSKMKLRNNIILDPDWVIHGLNFLMQSSAHVLVAHPDVLSHWYDFKDTGRLRKSLIDCLWSEDKECYSHREHLLDVMENLSIIAQPTEDKDILQDHEKYYWVPCMIHKRAPDYFKNTKLRTDISTTSTLCFVSKTKFIHIGVFHRLIASLLRIWPASKEGGEHQVFTDCCKFQVDDCHTLMVALADFVIHATVYLYSTDELNNILCVEIKECINSRLTDITSCFCPSSEFDVYVKCDRASQHTTEGLLAIRDWSETRCNCTQPAHTVNLQQLLKYWDKKDVRLSSLAKTDDRECFSKISCLLVDIGGKVLKRLLYFFTVRPNFSFDQFVHTKRNELLKLQKRKILSKGQIDIVLPQNGTTDLTNYDISLTSALLMNLIPNLNPHVTQKIQDVRNDRNNYHAHACSAQMTRSDFDVHWPRIAGNIIDLCKECLDPSFVQYIQEEIQTLFQSLQKSYIKQV